MAKLSCLSTEALVTLYYSKMWLNKTIHTRGFSAEKASRTLKRFGGQYALGRCF